MDGAPRKNRTPCLDLWKSTANSRAVSGAAWRKRSGRRSAGIPQQSLDELVEDYLDWLKSHGAGVWASDDKRQVAAYAAEIKRAVDQAVRSLRRRKGWV